ncbi:unnamed protein product [Amoebophrya sp. A120]|nr:unnamed protein product [Amoebophrya sp. A120]|eukprot:GSA120T00005028001.1
MAEKVIAQLDTNGDRQVSEKENGGVCPMTKVDLDKDGFMSKAELEEHCRCEKPAAKEDASTSTVTTAASSTLEKASQLAFLEQTSWLLSCCCNPAVQEEGDEEECGIRVTCHEDAATARQRRRQQRKELRKELQQTQSTVTIEELPDNYNAQHPTQNQLLAIEDVAEGTI